jgi:hypothetical protein
VRVGGHVVAWKSAGSDEQAVKLEAEVTDAARLIRSVGGDRSRVVALPPAEKVGLSGRCLVVIDKVRPTPDGYPRVPGERRRRPLG